MLTLVERRRVQPYYAIDHARHSLRLEIRTMSAIRTAIRDRLGDSDIIAPTRFVERYEIPEVPVVTEAWERLRAIAPLGSQYEWLGRWAESEDLHQLELAVHVDDRVYTFLRDHVRRVVENGLETWMLERTASPADMWFLGRFRFPLLWVSKVDMARVAMSHDFLDLMNMTWFCYRPTRRETPCGRCLPCHFAMTEGMAHRIPPLRRWRTRLGPRNLIRRLLRNDR